LCQSLCGGPILVYFTGRMVTLRPPREGDSAICMPMGRSPWRRRCREKFFGLDRVGGKIRGMKRTSKPLGRLITEARNPDTTRIDTLPTGSILRLINREDAKVAPEVKKAIPDIARAVELVASALRKGGRLFYVGAGTSGRLGVLDASECPPTFSTKPSTVQAIIAGGRKAVFRAVEGAEDTDASAELSARGVGGNDVVFGIAACGQTKFVRTALEAARNMGCRTVLLSSNPPGKDEPAVDVRITVLVGPEVIAGSTRMKAATAAKMILNMVTTAAMIKLGKTYGNLMVDLAPASEKLRNRAVRIIAHISGIRREQAEVYLRRAKGNVKVAVVMARNGVGYGQARRLLVEKEGLLRRALGEEKRTTPRKQAVRASRESAC
jgi:N-acetylmuramic acid 6-phosphate etherase